MEQIITKEEFLKKDIKYFLNSGEFYCGRKTWDQRQQEKRNLKFNI